MRRELKQLVNKISDKVLRKQVVDLIEGFTVEIGGVAFEGLSLEATPGGMRRHHAYWEGLIQHTVASATMASALCDVIEEIYRGEVDRDVVLAAVITHDLMKSYVYRLTEEGDYRMSRLGERVDHLTLIVSELIRRNFPLEVIHAVAAHHGRNGPISPRTIEALVCFVSDDADAKLNGEVLNAARFLLSDCAGVRGVPLTAEQAFAVVRAKQTRGCEGVKKELEKINAGKSSPNPSFSGAT
jgi:7,8-dihydroneopterin 2',3'-cyclic phosphate phosphodiesterase